MSDSPPLALAKLLRQLSVEASSGTISQETKATIKAKLPKAAAKQGKAKASAKRPASPRSSSPRGAGAGASEPLPLVPLLRQLSECAREGTISGELKRDIKVLLLCPPTKPKANPPKPLPNPLGSQPAAPRRRSRLRSSAAAAAPAGAAAPAASGSEFKRARVLDLDSKGGLFRVVSEFLTGAQVAVVSNALFCVFSFLDPLDLIRGASSVAKLWHQTSLRPGLAAVFKRGLRQLGRTDVAPVLTKRYDNDSNGMAWRHLWTQTYCLKKKGFPARQLAPGVRSPVMQHMKLGDCLLHRGDTIPRTILTFSFSNTLQVWDVSPSEDNSGLRRDRKGGPCIELRRLKVYARVWHEVLFEHRMLAVIQPNTHEVSVWHFLQNAADEEEAEDAAAEAESQEESKAESASGGDAESKGDSKGDSKASSESKSGESKASTSAADKDKGQAEEEEEPEFGEGDAAELLAALEQEGAEETVGEGDDAAEDADEDGEADGGGDGSGRSVIEQGVECMNYGLPVCVIQCSEEIVFFKFVSRVEDGKKIPCVITAYRSGEADLWDARTGDRLRPLFDAKAAPSSPRMSGAASPSAAAGAGAAGGFVSGLSLASSSPASSRSASPSALRSASPAASRAPERKYDTLIFHANADYLLRIQETKFQLCNLSTGKQSKTMPCNSSGSEIMWAVVQAWTEPVDGGRGYSAASAAPAGGSGGGDGKEAKAKPPGAVCVFGCADNSIVTMNTLGARFIMRPQPRASMVAAVQWANLNVEAAMLTVVYYHVDDAPRAAVYDLEGIDFVRELEVGHLPHPAHRASGTTRFCNDLLPCSGNLDADPGYSTVRADQYKVVFSDANRTVMVVSLADRRSQLDDVERPWRQIEGLVDRPLDHEGLQMGTHGALTFWKTKIAVGSGDFGLISVYDMARQSSDPSAVYKATPIVASMYVSRPVRGPHPTHKNKYGPTCGWIEEHDAKRNRYLCCLPIKAAFWSSSAAASENAMANAIGSRDPVQREWVTIAPAAKYVVDPAGATAIPYGVSVLCGRTWVKAALQKRWGNLLRLKFNWPQTDNAIVAYAILGVMNFAVRVDAKPAAKRPAGGVQRAVAPGAFKAHRNTRRV